MPGQPVIDFTEVETGIFEGLRTGEGVYILQNLAAARSLAKSMDQMIGDWAMVRGNGQSICGLTLTNTEATADNFQVFLKPKCDPAVAAFAPTQWRLDHGQILLLSASGETWPFEADDNAQWRLSSHAVADWMNVPLLYFEGTGKAPQRMGLAHPSICPYGAFATKDGALVLISIQNEREWTTFCASFLDEPDLPTKPGLRTTTSASPTARWSTNGSVRPSPP